MSLVDHKTLTRARRTRGGGHPRRQPDPATRDLEETRARNLDEGTATHGAVAAPAGHPQAHARQPSTKQAPIGPPQVAGEMRQPAPEREPPPFGLLVFLGAIFGLAVLKESIGRTAGPVVVKGVKSLPHLPPSFWIAEGVGTLGRIGSRVLGR